jgi:hypothetical protein
LSRQQNGCTEGQKESALQTQCCSRTITHVRLPEKAILRIVTFSV